MVKRYLVCLTPHKLPDRHGHRVVLIGY